MSVVAVTGYVPLPCTHRSHETYAALGGQLLSACDRSVCFTSSLQETWLAKRLGGVKPGGKDTIAYHCVQHQKFQWLEDAASASKSATTLVWIDYGILHLPRMTASVVTTFLRRVGQSDPKRIISPSADMFADNTESPCWRFLGGVLIVPRRMASWLNNQCRALSDHRLWEVNTLCRVANRHPDQFMFYVADHDASIMENYLCSAY